MASTFQSPIPFSLPPSQSTSLELLSPTKPSQSSSYASSAASGRIQVACRIRPLSSAGSANVEVLDALHLRYTDASGKSLTQSFNAIFGPDASQQRVMDDVGLPIARDCLSGINGAILCYGQTGSGKTHTMQGSVSESGRGLIPRVVDHLFAVGSAAPYSQLDVRCSYTEVAPSEKVRDLLHGSGEYERYREDAIRMTTITSAAHAARLIHDGQQRRTVARTAMNDASSRSHTLLTLQLSCHRDGRLVTASVTLVDLAGSERMNDNPEAQQREGIGINASLSALNRLLDAVIRQQAHVPFNDSTLTKMLRPFLDPRKPAARTVLFFHVSPEWQNAHDTRSTLKFAARCKTIKQQPLTANVTALTLEDAMVDFVSAAQDIDPERRRRIVDGLRRVAEGFRRQEGGGKRRKVEAAPSDSPQPPADAPKEQPTRLLSATVRLLQAELTTALAREQDKAREAREVREREQAQIAEALRLHPSMPAEAAPPARGAKAAGKENADVVPPSPSKPLSSPVRSRGFVSPGSPALQSPSRAPLSSIQAIIEAKVASLRASRAPTDASTPVKRAAVFDYVEGESGGYRFPSIDLDEDAAVRGLVTAMRSPIRVSLMR